MTHAYPYVASPNPNTFTANIVICDVNTFCSTTSANIIGEYTPPRINLITPSNAYATLTTAFTFNIIKGNYTETNLQVNWGDSSPTTFVSINSLTPAVNHAYSAAGNYVVTATVIDENTASNTVTNTIQVFPYVLPKISELTPSSALAGNSIVYSYTAILGTFPFATVNAVTINFGTGNMVHDNPTAGLNHVSFEYLANGNFSAVEQICDNNNVCVTNSTLISVSSYPWNFTTHQPIINYNVTNSSTPAQVFVQTTETDILPVTYTTQKDNVANDYLCTANVSTGGLFALKCIANPNAITYVNQTLYITIYAKDTDAVTKAVTEQINLIPRLKAQSVPFRTFLNKHRHPPLKTDPFVPLSPYLLIGVIAFIIILSTAFWYHIKGRQK